MYKLSLFVFMLEIFTQSRTVTHYKWASVYPINFFYGADRVIFDKKIIV